jgi:RNA polymerase sigma-70 factor (sigma-E family)
MADAAFDDFVRESLPTLGRYARALTGSAHSADDLVQETLVKVARAWRRIDGDGDPAGYARTVMFRTHVSAWRTLKRRPRTQSLPDAPDARDDISAAEARTVLRASLATLPRLQQAVLVLGYLDGAPDDEIARVIGRKQATVRSLRHRGLAALRAELTRDENPGTVPAGLEAGHA